MNDKDVMMADYPEERTDKVPTFVVAANILLADGPALFRSYQNKAYNATKCTIWEAGWATSADPTFFKSIQPALIGQGGTFTMAIDYSNPAELALFEAQNLWVTAKTYCLVSIGTGRLGAVKLDNLHLAAILDKRGSSIVSRGKTSNPETKHSTSRSLAGVRVLKEMAAECVKLTSNSEAVHQRLFQFISSARNNRLRYYRFNVESGMDNTGLEEWRNAEAMIQHTAVYMEEKEGETMRNQCVDDLLQSDCNCPIFIFH